uniref:TNFR-Cys domain-containing protein n=1 Tax=Amazona collaria TaxID=241587 RepID=A0A8B9FZT5_9PSIT
MGGRGWTASRFSSAAPRKLDRRSSAPCCSGRGWAQLRRLPLGAAGPCHGDVVGRGAMRGPALPCSSLGTVILTFVCMLTKESVEISPVPYTLQIHQVALDGRDPSSSLRENRQMQCQLGQYLHPRETHCCMRCHAGTYKAKDCDRPDQAPVCLPCANGTFTAVDNTMSKCFQCTRCRTEFQQIVETPCTPKQDTVCGCRKNQYQVGLADLFLCRNCSSCVNGIIASCTKNKDAICRCKPGFFLTLSNVCKPCNSCIGEECLQCHSPVTASPTPTGLNGSLVLGIIVAIFGVIFILYIVKKVVKLIQKRRLTSSSYSCVPLPQTTKEPVPEVEVKKGEISILLPESRKETELLVNATPPPVPLPQSSHEFPDCVRPARKRQLPDSKCNSLILPSFPRQMRTWLCRCSLGGCWTGLTQCM